VTANYNLSLNISFHTSLALHQNQEKKVTIWPSKIFYGVKISIAYCRLINNLPIIKNKVSLIRTLTQYDLNPTIILMYVAYLASAVPPLGLYGNWCAIHDE